MQQRNRPIAKLIKWFVNREKGMVVDARSEIQRRFYGHINNFHNIGIVAYSQKLKSYGKLIVKMD